MPINKIQSWAHETLEPATGAGFSFIKTYGDKMGTKKYVNYKPAKIHRGDKWFIWFSYRDPITGKFRRFKEYEGINRYKGLVREQYAEILQQAVNAALEDGYNPFSEPLFRKTWTVLQGINFFKQKMYDKGLRPKTISAYSSMVTLFTEGFKPVHNHSVSLPVNTCRSMLDNLKKSNKWSNTTYNNGLTFGRLLYSFFIENNIASENPFKSIKPLQTTKTINQPFDDKSFDLIKKKADPELMRFINFMYYTGTRPNEARQLKYEHIYRDRGMLYIPGELSKGKKDGYIPLSDKFLEMFPEGKGFIFGRPRNYFTSKFTELKRKLKLPETYTLYSTKHTRAIHLMQDGASPYAIMQLFRHSSLEVTMSYLRDLGVNVSREAADKAR